MNRIKLFFKHPFVRIAMSVVLLLIFYFRDEIIPADNKVLIGLGTVVTMIAIVFCMYLIAKSVSELAGAKKMQKVAKISDSDKAIKIWSMAELYAFLEQEDIIDIVIDNDGEKLKIGTAADYRRHKLVQKWYYIGEVDYSSLSEFQTHLEEIIKSNTVSVVYIGFDGEPFSITKNDE